jgi:putative ABC transport system permease protein
MTQASVSAMTLAVRVAGDPAAVAGEVRRIVRQLDPELPVAEMRTTGELVTRSVALPAYRAQLLTAFAAFALVMALAGVYSLTAFHVAQRKREVGIRLALGAAPRDVKAMVVGRTVRAVAIGCAIGAAAAVPMMRMLQGSLFGVTPGDPRAYLVAATILLLTALGASYVPARWAARVDPIATLRND